LPLEILLAAFLFLELHWLAAAGDGSLTCLGYDEFGAAFSAAVFFTYLIRHFRTPSIPKSFQLSLYLVPELSVKENDLGTCFWFKMRSQRNFP
jgi:hypothetical protein